MKIRNWICSGVMTLLFCLPQAGFAGDVDAGLITVSGRYETVLAPQFATLNLGIRHVAPQMSQGHQQMEATLTGVISGLKKLGIPEVDIVKSLIRQGVEYSWEKNKRRASGYFSECTMEIKVRKLDSLYAVYAEMARHNALEIRGTRYEREDMGKQERRALEKALKRARSKAEVMATTLGAKLGTPLQIQEQGAAPIRPMAEKMVMSRAANAPADPGGRFGSVRVSAGVTVAFQLLP